MIIYILNYFHDFRMLACMAINVQVHGILFGKWRQEYSEWNNHLPQNSNIQRAHKNWKAYHGQLPRAHGYCVFQFLITSIRHKFVFICISNMSKEGIKGKPFNSLNQNIKNKYTLPLLSFWLELWASVPLIVPFTVGLRPSVLFRIEPPLAHSLTRNSQGKYTLGTLKNSPEHSWACVFGKCRL